MQFVPTGWAHAPRSSAASVSVPRRCPSLAQRALLSRALELLAHRGPSPSHRHNGNILQSACQGHAELTRWHGATRRALHPMMQACVAASRLALPQGGTRSEPLSEVERGCRLGSGSLAGPWLRGSSAVRARARPTLTAPGAGRRATFRDRVLQRKDHVTTVPSGKFPGTIFPVGITTEK